MDERKIERAIEALSDDHFRTGSLTEDQVNRVLDKRGLSPEEGLTVRRQLEQLGLVSDPAEVGLAAVDLATTTNAPRANYRVDDDRRASAHGLLRKYLNEISSSKLLTPNEEIELARRIKVGGDASHLDKDDLLVQRQIKAGQAANDRMIQSNLRLVVSVAKAYARISGLDILDLVQEGTLGLMKAVERFDHTLGFRFSTYATWWIRQAITRGIANRGRMIRLPVHVTETLRKIRKVRRALRHERGRPPTVDEIAQQLGIPAAKVHFLQELREPISIEQPAGRDADTPIKDLVAGKVAPDADDLLVEKELARTVDEVLETLTPRQREVMELRFGLKDGTPRTLQEVGDMYGVTRERIRQIEAVALKRLRHPSRAQLLAAFVGEDTELSTEQDDD